MVPVAKDLDYDVWSEAMDPEKLWQAIVKTHKVDCVTSVEAIKELVARTAYQSIKCKDHLRHSIVNDS